MLGGGGSCQSGGYAVCSFCSFTWQSRCCELAILIAAVVNLQKLAYSLKGVPPSPELSGLLCCFITKRAFPGASASQDFRVEHSDNSTLTLCRTLQQTRHAECTSDASETASESTWRLTERGMQNLVPMHEVFRLTPVFDQIDTLLGHVEQGLEAVQDFSTQELLQVLQNRGFTLKQLPAKKKDRRALAPHTVDASRPILYCGSRNSVTLESGQTKAYMQALVLAPELFRGGSWANMVLVRCKFRDLLF